MDEIIDIAGVTVENTKIVDVTVEDASDGHVEERQYAVATANLTNFKVGKKYLKIIFLQRK